MSKIISIAMLIAALLGLYVIKVQMSKLDEEVVYAYYQKSIDATRAFDAGTLCGMMDRNYRSVDVVKTPRGEERMDLNRQQACKATRESMSMMKEVVAATRLEPDFKYVIESVTLSPDRRQAVVKVRASMSIGKRFSIATTGTETLVRRMGRVYSKGSDTRSTVSVR
jgi:hypothetical protein